MAEYISFQPSDFFSSVLYTGNGTAIGSGGHTITGVGFEPDFTWIKRRDNTDAHVLYDQARGANKRVYTNSNAAETTDAEGLNSWNSDGFVLGSTGNVNGPPQEMICYNWKSGTTTGIDTTGSTITPTAYSLNQTAGFSIIRYTGNSTAGAKIPHGLGTVPSAIFVKNRSGVWSWQNYMWQSKENVGDTPAPGEDSAYWNYNFGLDQNVYYWNNTDADAVNFTAGNNGTVNNGNDFVAYCWAQKPGYSKFGTFQGNASADGPFVYLGFRPAFLMIKNVQGSKNWILYDTKRLGYNVNNYIFQPDTDAAEATAPDVDLLATGFKCRENNGDLSGSGNVIMYWAFAEFPVVSSNGVPGVAR